MIPLKPSWLFESNVLLVAPKSSGRAIPTDRFVPIAVGSSILEPGPKSDIEYPAQSLKPIWKKMTTTMTGVVEP
jgi:hypothetical protein